MKLLTNYGSPFLRHTTTTNHRIGRFDDLLHSCNFFSTFFASLFFLITCSSFRFDFLSFFEGVSYFLTRGFLPRATCCCFWVFAATNKTPTPSAGWQDRDLRASSHLIFNSKLNTSLGVRSKIKANSCSEVWVGSSCIPLGVCGDYIGTLSPEQLVSTSEQR